MIRRIIFPLLLLSITYVSFGQAPKSISNPSAKPLASLAEMSMVEQHYEGLYHSRFFLRGAKTLHDHVTSSGDKGLDLPSPSEHSGNTQPDSVTFNSIDEAEYHQLLCLPNISIVEATLIQEQSIISSDKSNIYTLYRFHISTPIYGSPVNDGQGTVVVARVGGQVIDEGERIRVDTGIAGFQIGRSYIITLLDHAGSVYYEDGPVIAVRSGHLRFQTERAMGVMPGVTINSFRNKISSTLAARPCQH